MMRESLTVYLADDHTVVRKGMLRLLKTFQRVKEVKEAANGKELLALIEAEPPDAVILDLEMPVMSGMDAARHISLHYPEVKMLILTMHTEAVFIHKLMDIGIHGFLSKSVEPAEVERALYSIVDKDFYKNEIVEEAMRKNISGSGVETTSRLSSRELEILLLICQELTPTEISNRLQISEKTFFNHRTNILVKTRSRTNVGLLRFAVQRGYIELS